MHSGVSRDVHYLETSYIHIKIKVKQVALSKVIQVMQYQIQLCTTPGYIKRQNYFIFAIIVNSLGFVN